MHSRSLEVGPTKKLQQLGLTLPKPWTLSASDAPKPIVLGTGVQVYAEFVRVTGNRVTISGHVPIDDQGAVTGPYGQVGADVSLAQAETCAERVMLGIFSSLVREIGSLDRIASWIRLFGMVNAAPDFHAYPSVINAASKMVYDVFGENIGKHSRVAIGVAGLPFNVPVEIEAEVQLREE